MCCGQKRAELRSSTSPPTAWTASQAASQQQTRPSPAQVTVRPLTLPKGIAGQSRPIYPLTQTMRSPTLIASPYSRIRVRSLEDSFIRGRG